MKNLLIVLILMLSSSIAFSQEKPDTTDLSEKSVVYIYGDSADATLDKIKPMVYLDGEKIAQVRPEHYFIAIFEPGNHVLHFKEKKRGGIKMDFEAGKTYYFRVTWSDAKSRFLKSSIRPTGMVKVEKESAEFVLNEIDPVDRKNIKNPKIAFLSIPN